MGDGLSFSVKVFVMPEVKLADYKKIASGISLEEKKAEDRELEATLNWIKRSRAKYSLKNFPAEKGDFAEIEYWSEDLPEIGENKKRKDAFILGEGHFFQGFEEIIPGMKSGEEKKFELEIPEDHSYKKIAGKKVRFGLKLNSLQKVEYPELNDSFAKSLGKFETIKDLEQNIKEGIKAEKESAELQKKRTEALELIAEKSEIDIPGILIDREKENLLENLKKNISQTAQVSYEEYLKQTEKTEKEIEEMLSKEALKKVKTYLVLREIGKREGVSVSDEEIEQEANDMLKHYPNPDQASKPAGVDLEKLKDYTREVIRTEKTFKIIENLLKKI
ncbi:MAG: trigger factor [Candidatus Nealsonbacteria bacterium RIFOXYD1_FULL_39_11]|nr:MAG: trigger factor [Candidatus Nealsonbacteria bacterium RIFOXYD1_FULL_39_11]